MLGANMLSMSVLSLFRNAVQFGMSIAITAFIGPADYGIVVFTLPFVTLIAMLTDLGLSSAITRAPVVDRATAGAALTVMLAAGVALGGAMAAAAGPLADLIAMRGLGPVMAAMGGVVVLSIAATTPRALLERQLRYGVIAAVEATAVVVAAAAGLIAAWHGAGVWSLVLYNVVNHSLRAAVFVTLARGAMQPNFGWSRLGPLLSFGGWVLATNLLNFLARNSDNLLIGAWLGAAAVGIYGLAYQFMLAPLMAITWPASSILVATLRREAHDLDRAAQMIEGIIAATAMLTFPAMAFLTFGLALPTEMLLSPRWQAVPAVAAWLAPLGAIQSIASYNGAVLMVAGRARRQFALTVINAVALVVTFVVTLPFGLATLVTAYVIVSTALNIGFVAQIVAHSRMTWRRLATALAPAAMATSAGLVLTALAGGLHPASWQQWVATTATYAAGVLGTYALLASSVRARLSILGAVPAEVAV